MSAPENRSPTCSISASVNPAENIRRQGLHLPRVENTPGRTVPGAFQASYLKKRAPERLLELGYLHSSHSGRTKLPDAKIKGKVLRLSMRPIHADTSTQGAP